MNNDPPKMRLGIVGGGIGGLTLAVAVGQLDHYKNIEVHIYEAAPKLEEIGAGLTIFNRTWELLGTIGCQELIKKRAFTYSHLGSGAINNDVIFHYRKSDQKDGINFLNLTIPGGSWSIHRADLHQALLMRLGENTHVHLSSRATACTEHDNAVTLELHDGRTASFDLVIGADGVRSVIRKEFLTAKFPGQDDHIHPLWSGSIGYRGLIPKEILAQKDPGHRAISTPIMYCGKNKHIVVYPISMGRLINVVAYHSKPEKEGTPFLGGVVQGVARDEVLAKFNGWEDEVLKLLECIDEPSRWPIMTSKPLSAYGGGRVALLGDAAHAMTPHLGSGAGQAMEDAYVLGSIIAQGVQDGVSVARMSETYNTVRQPMGNFVLESSRRQGFRFELNSPGLEDVQENQPVPMSRLVTVADEIIRAWKWMWNTSVQEDQKRARALL